MLLPVPPSPTNVMWVPPVGIPPGPQEVMRCLNYCLFQLQGRYEEGVLRGRRVGVTDAPNLDSLVFDVSMAFSWILPTWLPACADCVPFC